MSHGPHSTKYVAVLYLLLLIDQVQVYSEQDISKMPLELGNALSHEREPVDDPEIRKQSLEALYLISLQVRPLPMTNDLCSKLLS